MYEIFCTKLCCLVLQLVITNFGDKMVLKIYSFLKGHNFSSIALDFEIRNIEIKIYELRTFIFVLSFYFAY